MQRETRTVALLRDIKRHFQKKKNFSVERCPELAFSRHYRIYSGVWRSVVSTRKDGAQGRTGDGPVTLLGCPLELARRKSIRRSHRTAG